MIQKNELRIGSVVNYNLEGTLTPTVIDWQDLQWLSERPEDFNESHKPCPITIDFLLKNGFKTFASIASDTFYIGNNPVTHDWLFDIVWIKGDEYPFYLNGYFKIKSVHKLQNLYFALTGTELTINL
jgi:hypothetical protein